MHQIHKLVAFAPIARANDTLLTTLKNVDSVDHLSPRLGVIVVTVLPRDIYWQMVQINVYFAVPAPAKQVIIVLTALQKSIH